jgi:hypothetical protein
LFEKRGFRLRLVSWSGDTVGHDDDNLAGTLRDRTNAASISEQIGPYARQSLGGVRATPQVPDSCNCRRESRICVKLVESNVKSGTVRVGDHPCACLVGAEAKVVGGSDLSHKPQNKVSEVAGSTTVLPAVDRARSVEQEAQIHVGLACVGTDRHHQGRRRRIFDRVKPGCDAIPHQLSQWNNSLQADCYRDGQGTTFVRQTRRSKSTRGRGSVCRSDVDDRGSGRHAAGSSESPDG